MNSSALTVRRLLIDLRAPFPKYWCSGDPFRSAFFNALSMSFPRGEQMFIDSVKRGVAVLPPERQQEFSAVVKGFIGQEATHRRIHALFNQQLESQGLKNHWEPIIDRRSNATANADPRHGLGVTAAIEHLTAILSHWGLKNPEWLQSDDPRLQTLWLWHFSEEIEHKSIAIDLYRAAGGNEAWRIKYFKHFTRIFLMELSTQTLRNLWRHAGWWQPSTWLSAASFLFGKKGLVPTLYPAWKQYLRDDFHPDQVDETVGLEWLDRNAIKFTTV